MRRIDKKLNMIKANLLAESRYLESKGLLSEVINIDSDDDFESLKDVIDYGDTEKSIAFRNVIDALKKIKNKVTPKDSGIGRFLEIFKELASYDEYEKVKSVSSDIIRKHEDANKGYKKYEEVEWVGDDKSFKNGKTLKKGDLGKFIGAQNDEECVVEFPSVGLNILTTFRFIKKVDDLNETMLPIIDNFGDRKIAFAENEDELEEGFLNRLLDIPSKKDEAKKQQAIEEIRIFNFESLFFQPSVDENGEMKITPEVIKELRDRVIKAGNKMPTVKEFNSLLFEFNGKVSHAFIIDKNGEKINGIIPSCFEPIRDVNDKISNDEARRRTIGYLG